MKRTLLILLLVISQLPAQACDICGCGVGSYYLGILPEYNKRFVGLRYQHKTLTTHLGPTGNRTPLTSDETYQTLELWGGFNFGKKWRLMTILPYNFNQRSLSGAGESGKKQGLGDVLAVAYYKVFEKSKTTVNNKLLVHSLWAGLGVKAPTGQYEDKGVDASSPNYFQLGTASTDFLGTMAYDLRVMDWGLNTNLTYKANTENKHEYRYASKFSLNTLTYYKFNIQNKVRIAPNAGLVYETQHKDQIYGKYPVAESGGYLLGGILGVEVNAGRFSFGGNYQTPLKQNLADGRVLSGDRMMVHFSVAL